MDEPVYTFDPESAPFKEAWDKFSKKDQKLIKEMTKELEKFMKKNSNN